MEGANEPARRAVNGILAVSADIDAPWCDVWPLEEPALLNPAKQEDARRYARGLPHILARL